jgi:hypothetical protein
MKIVIPIIIILLVSSVFLGGSNGTVQFAGQNNKVESHESSMELFLLGKTQGNVFCALNLYQSNLDNVILEINVTTMALLWQDANFETWLAIDDQALEKKDSINLHTQPSALGEFYTREYTATLNGLSEGLHVIRILVSGNYYRPEGGKYEYEGNATFIIDNTPPRVSDITIQNTTYYQSNLELTCTTSEPFVWIAYSLDNQANVTFQTGNSTDKFQQAQANLTELTEGSHNIIIFASDIGGTVGASQIITFTIGKSGDYFTVAIVVVSVIAGILAGIGISINSQKKGSLINQLTSVVLVMFFAGGFMLSHRQKSRGKPRKEEGD